MGKGHLASELEEREESKEVNKIDTDTPL